MTESQRNEPFREPSRDHIPAISRAHVGAMEASDDDAVWRAAGMHHLVLRTQGRRTGREHKVALPYWRDPDGNRIVVASYAGAPEHPSWYLNLADLDANPEVLVHVQHRSFWADVEVLDGDEYVRIWGMLTADRAYYEDYVRRTDRKIPLVRLREVRPG